MWPKITRKKHHCEFYCHFILNIYSFFVIQYYLIMVLHVLWISYKFIQKLYKNLNMYSYSGGRFLNKIIIKKQNWKSHINWCCVYNKGTWTYMYICNTNIPYIYKIILMFQKITPSTHPLTPNLPFVQVESWPVSLQLRPQSRKNTQPMEKWQQSPTER